MRRRIKVKYSKLGRDGVWGYAHYEDNSIELDVRATGKKHMELLHHEAIHLLLPRAGESEVERISIALTDLLWSQNYRRVDNENKIPLQDGKK